MKTITLDVSLIVSCLSPIVRLKIRKLSDEEGVTPIEWCVNHLKSFCKKFANPS